MQVGRVAAAVAVIGAVVSGCGGPSQAGTAVIVGADAVPIEHIQSQLDTALAKKDLMAQLTAQGGTTGELARSIVTRAVLHDLLDRRATEEGIVVTDSQIDAHIAQNAEADALFADPRTSARAQTFDAASSPDNASTVLFGVPVGTVVTFQPNPQQSTWIVARVVDRRTDAPSDPAAVNGISQAQLIAIGERLLQPTADPVGIRVNPRYGVWDPIQLRIVAEDQQ